MTRIHQDKYQIVFRRPQYESAIAHLRAGCAEEA
jgi:hypothetical protein